ncbi:MAG: aminoacyl-tRNA hydrolase [Desulfovibrionaceae bacterium]|nr:aminoacyl-tRNA hydrolase [Desulfovibrionaceae bacterium]MBF0513879.1 aminoacyl-tRNA hydrolase [Desulfovibrionaceae bacterium]
MAFDGCLAGLGNPGPAYAGNRHNLGFLAVDAVGRICRHPRPPKTISAPDAEMLDVVAPGGAGRILCVKPLTFMNLSGFAVSRALRYYKIPLDRLLLVHDELDLPLGRIQLKRGGGDAGHNGVASVAEQLGTADFYRLRLGVGRPPSGSDVAAYVLSDFPAAEADLAKEAAEAAAKAALDFFVLGAAKTAARIKAAQTRPKTEPDNSRA